MPGGGSLVPGGGLADEVDGALLVLMLGLLLDADDLGEDEVAGYVLSGDAKLAVHHLNCPKLGVDNEQKVTLEVPKLRLESQVRS